MSKNVNPFQNHFSMVSWIDLPEVEKQQHQFRNCKGCLLPQHHDIYIDYRKNQVPQICNPSDSISSLAQTSATKEEYIKKISAAADIESQARWGSPASLNTSTANKENCCQQAKAEIVKKTASSLKDALKEQTNRAVLRRGLSYNQFVNWRRDSTHDETLEPKRKQYKANPDSYQFDEAAVKKDIEAAIESGAKKINFSKLSRDHTVLKGGGTPASNGNQVLKAYAVREGLVEDSGTPRERRAKRKLDIDGTIINLPDVFPTLEDLTNDTKQKIDSGEWDVGTPIVPIQLRVKKVNSNGKVETLTTTLYGRAFTLQQIMDMTLKRIDAAGLLRPLYPHDSDINKVLKDLTQKGK